MARRHASLPASRGLLVALLALLALALAPGASAEDGRIEINQACALAGGCLAGDAPGFPITLGGSSARSFLLTSDLLVSDPDTDAITVSADGVSIDLGGFAVRGPVACTGTGSALTCDAGLGRGIAAISTDATSLRNGSVSGFAGSGVVLGGASRVTGLSVHGNGWTGLGVGSGSVVQEVIAHANGFDGISTGDGATVERCISRHNRFYGLLVGDTGSLVSNVAGENGQDGIHCGDGNLVRGNTAPQNEADGIDCRDGNHVSENSARGNGDDGIELTANSTARANSIVENGGFGIQFLGVGNSFGENHAGDPVSGGVDAGGNYCSGGCP